MKKTLLLLFSLLIFVGNVWGADCYLINDSSERSWFTSGSETFPFSCPPKSYSVDITKSMLTAIGSVHLYESSDNSSWTEIEEIGVGDLKKNSYKTFTGNLKESSRYLKISFSGSYTRKIKNIKVTQKKYLTITSATSHNFGNVVYDGSSTDTWTVEYKYSSTSVRVESNNTAFTVSQSTAGNANCGKAGTGSFIVTFKPTKIGEHTGTITVGSATIPVSGMGTFAVPAKPSVAISYTSADVSWEPVSGADSYIVNWYRGSTKVGSQTVTGATTKSYKVENLIPNGTSYSFTIQSKAGSVSSDESEKTTVSTTKLLPPSLSVSKSYTSATVSWTPAGDTPAEATYVVYLNGSSTGVEVSSSPYEFTNLELGTSYTVSVKSKLSGQLSDNASTEAFTTDDLDAPQNLSSDASYTLISLFWGSVTDATGYRIYNLTNDTYEDIDLSTTSEGVVSYSESGLNANTTYSFRVVPMYNDKLSKKKAEITATTTDMPPVPPTQACELYRDNTEYSIDAWKNCSVDYNFDDAMYKCDITFNAKYAIAFPWEFKKNTNLQAKVGDSWQTIWYEEDKIKDSYQEFKVSLPDGTTAVRFYTGGTYSSTQRRSYYGVTVNRRNELSASANSLDFGTPYIGQSTERTLSIDYSNIADMTAILDPQEGVFTASIDLPAACTYGSGKPCVIKYQPVTLDAQQAASITIYNGKTTTVSLTGGVKRLPAPENFQISETTPQSITLTWDDVNITETGYKVVCKQGNDIIETKNVGGDVTTCTFTSLAPNTEYTYTITTMYNTIENGSAVVSGTTNLMPAPQNFALDAASVRAFSARFTWTEVTGATGYKLEWQWNDEIETETDIVGNVSEYRITELKPNTTYSVKITTLYGSEEQETSDAVEVTITCVVNTTATGDEPTSQLHTITLLSGAQLDDLSYVQGAVIKFKSYTESQHIKFVQLNVTMNNSRVTFTEPEVELTVSSNIYIESVYEYAGIAQVVDEHGDVVYGTLTDAVNAAEEGATINLLGDVEQDMVVNKYIKFNGNGHDIDNLYIKKNGNVELTGDVTIVKDFGLEVTPDKAGQYSESGSELLILGDAYIDVQFDNVKRDKWYAFTVPFPVKMDEVKNAQTLSPLVYGTDYLFLGFDGEARAKGEKGWIRYTTPGTLEPGQLYMIGTYGSTVHRFYKVKSAALVSSVVSFDLESHASAKGGNLADWNALGNSQLFNVDANQHGTQFDEDVIAQIYQSATDSYLAVQLREHVMSVTNPIFVQRTEKCTNVSINKTDGLRSANAESALYNLQIAKEGAANFDDQMFVAASDNAPSEYVAGYALMKLGLTNSIAQIYSNMYNTNLCMIKAPYAANSVADIPLTLYAPAAGNYTLSLGKQVSDGTALYLVKDGTEIHEFNADGSYTVYLAKGTSNSYSLRLKSTDGEDITTPAAETEAGNVKVYVQESVLVIEGLAEGGSYAVGNMIRTLYSGTSNGGDVRIPLTEKGVYWVNAGSAKVKVLNK